MAGKVSRPVWILRWYKLTQLEQRIVVMDIQIGHDLAGLFAAKENPEHGRFSELLAILKALQQVLKVVLHRDSV